MTCLEHLCHLLVQILEIKLHEYLNKCFIKLHLVTFLFIICAKFPHTFDASRGIFMTAFNYSFIISIFIKLVTGLNAGDEILQLNGKDARTLTFNDMKVAFAQVSLSLTVNTLPPVDRRQLCFLPPRRSDAVDNLYTDIFSQSQGQFLLILSAFLFWFLSIFTDLVSFVSVSPQRRFWTTASV